MSLKRIGVVKAACRPEGRAGEQGYRPVGSIFTGDRDELVIKIDTLPIASENWTGWLNVSLDSERDDAGRS